jgi:hypothetical protein
LLLQGHRRRQAVDGIHIGHANLVDQAPGIGRDRFEIAPLGFGIQRGERQRGLARTGHAGEHHQGIAGNIDIDVLQVVLAGATDADETAWGGRAWRHEAVLV